VQAALLPVGQAAAAGADRGSGADPAAVRRSSRVENRRNRVANLAVHEQRVLPAGDTAVSGPDVLASVT
jgi:hypothetical protein